VFKDGFERTDTRCRLAGSVRDFITQFPIVFHASQGSIVTVLALPHQFCLVEYNHGADAQAMNGNQVTFDQVAAWRRMGCNDNQCLVEVGGNRLFALPGVSTDEHIVPGKDAGYHGRLSIRSLDFYPVSAIRPADRAAVLAVKTFAIIQLDHALTAVGNQDECGLRQNAILAVRIFCDIKFIPAIVPVTGIAQTLSDMNKTKQQQDKQQRLIWLDLEMTGLNTDTDSIIEIATIITDSDLNELAEGPVFAITHPEPVLQAMDDWNTKHHQASGLWQRVIDSKASMSEAEQSTLAFLAQWTESGSSPLCGNSICQDRRFLYRLMPKLERWFHYRNLDVSSLKELAARWSPGILKGLVKQNRHEALSDIRESIEELRYYRRFMGDLGGGPDL
jgi:oligoribonuclease